ncbi:hypothetical protein ABPG75_008443 [Micractinium tetrahymenae]
MQALLASQNARAWATTVAGAASWLGVCSAVGKLGLLPPRLARKLTHIGTGPLYMLCWPLYAAHPASRWLCASVPALAGLRFAAVGAGLLRDDALVASSSRSGWREELLQGPLWYAVAHVAATLLFWRHSPAGVLALSLLCGGDGLAEVVGAGLAGTSSGGGSGASRSAGAAGGKGSSTGHRGRRGRLPHNPDKSVAGSLACWLGGAAAALPLLAHFRAAGMFDGMGAAGAGLPAGSALLAGVLLCSAVGAAVESLPLGEADNVVVTAATALAAHAWFGF